MSNLLKETLKKNAKTKNPNFEEEIQDELQDKVIELDDIDFPQKKAPNLEKFSPTPWQNYLKITEHISYGIPIYLTKSH